MNSIIIFSEKIEENEIFNLIKKNIFSRYDKMRCLELNGKIKSLNFYSLLNSIISCSLSENVLSFSYKEQFIFCKYLDFLILSGIVKEFSSKIEKIETDPLFKEKLLENKEYCSFVEWLKDFHNEKLVSELKLISTYYPELLSEKDKKYGVLL